MVPIWKNDPLWESQLERATILVRKFAMQVGTNYLIWAPAEKAMAVHRLDKIDVADCLSDCWVFDLGNFLGATRYRTTGEVRDGKFCEMLISVWEQKSTMEVISLKLEESK